MPYIKKYPINFTDDGDDVHRVTEKFINELSELYTVANDLDAKKVYRIGGQLTDPVVNGGNFSGGTFSGTTSFETVTISRGAKIGGNDVITVDSNGLIQSSVLPVILPRGLIMLWHGTLETIPSGWLLCDGQNGTPNLRDKFVVGAGGKHEVGATGGTETHILTEAEMPTHVHEFPGSGGGSNTGSYSTALGACSANVYIGEFSTRSTGGGQPHNNLPPYYGLYYIMKA